MNAPKYLQNTITEYSIQQKKIYGNYSRPARYDLLSVVMICLGNLQEQDYRSNEYQKLLRLLAVLASEEMRAQEKLHIMEEECHIATKRELEGKVNIMCNWSDGVIDRVTEKVTKRVTEEVTREVTHRVSCEKDIAGVENVMRAFNLSAQEACEVLKIRMEDYEAAKEYLSTKENG